MIYLLMVLAAAVLWILNVIVGTRFASVYGRDNVFFSKTVENGNNMFWGIAAIAGIAISYYYVDFLKWVILVFFGLAAAWEALIVIMGVWQIAIDRSHLRNSFDFHEVMEKMGTATTTISNFLSLLLSLVVVFGTIHICFGITITENIAPTAGARVEQPSDEMDEAEEFQVRKKILIDYANFFGFQSFHEYKTFFENESGIRLTGLRTEDVMSKVAEAYGTYSYKDCLGMVDPYNNRIISTLADYYGYIFEYVKEYHEKNY